MYILKVEQSFDSAHFLAGYKGKCSNIHGHRWKVEIKVKSETLIEGGQMDGMIVDFGELKRDVKEMVNYYDHSLIIEEGTMREKTLKCLLEDKFNIIQVKFRPTAENFAKFFFDYMREQGYNVKSAEVYETPNNSAVYE